MAPAPPRKQAPTGKPRQAAPAPRPPPAPARQQRPEPRATPEQRRHETPRQQAVQRKAALPTSQPGDAAEREADQRATQVMRSSATAPPVRERPPAPVLPDSRQAAGSPAPLQLGGEHQARLGSGEALPQPLRGQFEARFGQDLGQVRIVNDGAAAQAAASIEARAFTLGPRIAFAAGEYRPETPEGQWLLAHEITHVLQQRDSSVPRQVMRGFVGGPGSPGSPGGSTATAPAFAGGGAAAPLYRVTQPLPLPPIKARHLSPYRARASEGLLVRPAGYDREEAGTRQADIWAGITPNIALLGSRVPLYGPTATLPLQVANKTVPIPALSAASFSEQLRRPRWNNLGEFDFNENPMYDIDHMIEYQIGGVDELANLELLDSAHNRSVGGQFRGALESAMRADIEADAAAAAPDPRLDPYRTGRRVSADQLTAFKRDVTVAFTRVEGRGERTTRPPARRAGSSSFLAADEVRELRHVLELLPPTTPSAGSPTEFSLLAPGGAMQLGRIRHDNGQITTADLQRGLRRGMAGFTPTALTLGPLPGFNDPTPERENIGHLEGTLDLGPQVIIGGTAGERRRADPAAGGARRSETLRMPVVRTGDFQGRLQDPEVADWPAEFTPSSPLDIQGVSVGRGVYARALLRPDHPALAGLQIPAQIIDGRLQLAYTIDTGTLSDRLRFPGFSVTASSLRMAFDGETFSVGGEAQFEIRNFGLGSLRAELDSDGHFQLEGGFSADPRLFDSAEMRLWYRSVGGFGGEGRLAITDPNKIRGVRAASVQAGYEEGVFSAEGTVEPAIPGLQSAGLTVRYGPDESGAQSLLVGGDLQLAEGVPGVRGGTVHVQVQQTGEAWAVSAEGELQAAVAGIDATLRASYDDGAFSASVEAPFSAGERVTGTLLVGVSNQPADSEGRPLEGATPGDTLLAYGRGTATVQLSDTLQGDFEVRVGTDAAVAISGSVGLAEPITLFEQRRWDRELLRVPTVSIPIFGVAVGGNVVGIAATIGGGLQAEASVGPGQIDEGRIGITDFNPAQPESLHVTGRLRFVVPANAGITGHLDAGISAGAAVIRVTGGLSLGLGLGVDASVATPVDLDWTPTEGLVLAASLQASATPRLRASVNGFAEVVADALVTSFTLWRRDYTLAEREFGSGLRVGIEVPVAWRQQTGLDFDFDRVQFQVPDLSPEGALGALLREEGSEQQENDEG